MLHFLTQVKLDDVFKSTQDQMNAGPDSNRLLGLLLGMVAIVLLLIVVHYRRQREVRPRATNHRGKLLREVLKQLPLRSAEVKQLKALAEQENCTSPLVLLLCPSVLTKGLQKRGAKANRKVLARMATKLGARVKTG